MDSPLKTLASRYGVAPGYHDVWGQWRDTGEDSQRAILAAMGVAAADDGEARAALEALERDTWQRVVAPVTVLRARELARGVRIQLPESALSRPLAWRLTEEGGEVREERFTPLKLPLVEEHTVGGRAFRAFMLRVPVELPEGYHRLAILENGSLLGQGTIAVAPERCYLPPALQAGARLWGTTVQLYGLRSQRPDGLGNFTDLRACAEAWGERGAGIVGTNPLHAISLRDPGHASPYSPSSRLFLNTLYLDVEAMADFAELASHDRRFAERWRDRMLPLRDTPEVDYAAVACAKREIFARLYEHFRKAHLANATPRARAFLQFRDVRGPALRRHALHEALELHFGAPWRQWPAEYHDPQGEAARAFRDEHPEKVGLHEYLQWQADLQLGVAQNRCEELGMAVGLYADLAISIGPDGSEAWANQKLYALGVSVGAPPDEFNRQGQDWGLPPLSPPRLREAAYAPLVATLRANMQRAGALRIDHVMGLYRLWWVPSGCKADQGAYVHYPLDDLLGIVALESQRHQCLVIGEDLGTVPDELRVKLADADVLSYRLLLFEREGAGFKPPEAYPRGALVAWSTHDLPTLAGWWGEEDVRTRAALGQYDEAMQREQRSERAASRQGLLHALGMAGLGPPGLAPTDAFAEPLADAVHAYVARTPAAVMVAQMEDVLGIVEQANLPGTVEEHPNWRRRLPLAIEDWGQDPRFRRLTQDLAAQRGGRKTRRELPAELEGARIPRATYRVQLHGEYTFEHAMRLVPYLARLGISDLYCSPFLKARPGSKHGYDIVDHDAINPEIGTREQLDRLVATLKQHGMAMLMDIVPNHMGVLAADNAWWQDVLENGPASALAEFFDIDWQSPSEQLANRVLLPVLGDHYGVELAAGRLVLAFEPETGSFAVRYYTHRLPIDPREYPRILAPAVRELEEAPGAEGHLAQSLRSLMEAFARLPARHEAQRAQAEQRNLDKEVAKGRLAAFARTHGVVAQAIERAVELMNGRTDDPESFDALHDLLERQAFRLAYWRVAQDEINYRRFFDINDLAALRQEHPPVFDATHRLITQLVREGAVAGLRIDHPDGLYDPREYFRKLQEACGKPTYVLVEKIVAPFENVPEDWAVHGTTGYRFANVVNGLFVDPAAEARLTRTYTAFIGDETPFHAIARRAKRMILRTALASELTVLTSRLMKIARADRATRDFTFTTLREGLTEVIAAFPVYRTYIDDHVRSDDRKYVDWAITQARNESRAADVSVFDFLRDALTCELPVRSPRMAAAVRHFARKVQQLTSPVMAKGVEDTSFYIYNRLLSLNDVGGDPDEFGFPPARFHRASSHRARYWRHTMLATSTHDNKRSEDVRARIDTISELVPEWRLQLRKWHRMNLERKAEVDGQPAPSRNDEYLLYQVLLGSHPVMPAPREELDAYTERIVAYMQKATREAKQRTSWANTNAAYEQATEKFVRALLEERPGNGFLEDLRAALVPVTWLGFLNSLAMVAVKYTSPGVPDTYQGNELFDFSLVDPDNRRPVDYAAREQALASLEALGERPGAAALAALLANLRDGRAKLYILWRLLRLRAAREALFRDGSYTAVRTPGERGKHLIAFARRQGSETCVTVAPRLVASLGLKPGELPCGEVWGDTRIELPFLKEGTVLRNVFTGEDVTLERSGLRAATLLARFPAAVLVDPATGVQ